MNKKGELIELPLVKIIDLFFIGLVIFSFLLIQFKVKDNTLHDLRIEAIDYAFTKDAVSISSGETSYIYKTKENIKLEIKENCQIETKTKLKKDFIPTKYYCSKTNENLEETIEENQIIIKKR